MTWPFTPISIHLSLEETDYQENWRTSACANETAHLDHKVRIMLFITFIFSLSLPLPLQMNEMKKKKKKQQHLH